VDNFHEKWTRLGVEVRDNHLVLFFNCDKLTTQTVYKKIGEPLIIPEESSVKFALPVSFKHGLAWLNKYSYCLSSVLFSQFL